MKNYYIAYGTNALLVLIGLLLLFFTANISFGTKEYHEQMVTNNVVEYFFGRLSINVVASLVIVLLMWLLNIALRSIFNLTELKTTKIAVVEFIVFVLLSGIFILIGL